MGPKARSDYLPKDWVSWARSLRNAKSREIQSSLNEIEHRLIALREPLDITTGVDLRKAALLAASFENLVDHFNADIKVWMNHPGQRNAKSCVTLLNETAAFSRSAHQLHENLLSHHPHAKLQEACRLLRFRLFMLHCLRCVCRRTDAGISRLTQAAITSRLSQFPAWTMPSDDSRDCESHGGFAQYRFLMLESHAIIDRTKSKVEVSCHETESRGRD